MSGRKMKLLRQAAKKHFVPVNKVKKLWLKLNKYDRITVLNRDAKH